MNIKEIFEMRESKCILILAILVFVTLFLSLSFFHHDIVQTYLWSWDPQNNPSYTDTSYSYVDISPTQMPVTNQSDRVIVYNRPENTTNYSVSISNVSGRADSYTVTLENLDQNKSMMYAQISSMYPGDRRAAYVRDGFVYVIRNGTDSQSPADIVSYPGSSLWRYDGSGTGTQLLSGVPGQFTLSRTGAYTAFYDPITQYLTVYDLGSKKKIYTFLLGDSFFKVFDPVHVGSNWNFTLLGWDYWDKVIWGTFTKDGKSTGEIISIKTSTEINPVKIYTIPEIQKADPGEMDVSSLYPYLVFSDFNLYGNTSGVHLYSLNLDTKVKKTLYETNFFSSLSPVIVDNDAVSVYDSQKLERVRVKLMP